MKNIWFCELFDYDKKNDDYSLSYLKLLYENIPENEVEEYIDYILKEEYFEKGERFGVDNQCIELVTEYNNKTGYCLFIED